MTYNLKEKCETSKEREFFYGAKINKNIKDAYMGLCFLEPRESDRKVGPGRGHEELIYLLNGRIEIKGKEEEHVLNEGYIYHIPDGLKLKMKNLTDNRVYFMIAGGHTKHHKH